MCKKCTGKGPGIKFWDNIQKCICVHNMDVSIGHQQDTQLLPQSLLAIYQILSQRFVKNLMIGPQKAATIIKIKVAVKGKVSLFSVNPAIKNISSFCDFKLLLIASLKRCLWPR